MKLRADLLSIEDAATAAGTTASVLRQWEARYGWPDPPRDPRNRYRVYPRHLVDIIRRVVRLTLRGHQVSSILVDGEPRWPIEAARPITWTRYGQMPNPPTSDALRFKIRLGHALHAHDVAAVQTALHSTGILLRPGERMLAAWMPAVFGAREWDLRDRPLARDIPRLVRRLAGSDVADAIDARWLTALAIG